MGPIQNYSEEIFESIKHYTEGGNEYWSARELQPILEYSQWRNFELVIEKAKTACEKSKNIVSAHFAKVSKMVAAGVAPKPINDYMLSRYACYLIVQNGNPRKDVIALGQTYFAVKTRQQELIDNYDQLSENQKRLAIRNEMISHNKALAEIAKTAVVATPQDYAIFQNKGYQGLYGGLGVKEIHRNKGLKSSQKILDHMGSTELAANLFRATQTEEKLNKDGITDKTAAKKTHFEVGKKVRKAIKDIGGTMPENLPTPEKSIQQIETDLKLIELKGK